MQLMPSGKWHSQQQQRRTSLKQPGSPAVQGRSPNSSTSGPLHHLQRGPTDTPVDAATDADTLPDRNDPVSIARVCLVPHCCCCVAAAEARPVLDDTRQAAWPDKAYTLRVQGELIVRILDVSSCCLDALGMCSSPAAGTWLYVLDVAALCQSALSRPNTCLQSGDVKHDGQGSLAAWDRSYPRILQ